MEETLEMKGSNIRIALRWVSPVAVHEIRILNLKFLTRNSIIWTKSTHLSPPMHQRV
jgi:hypothetical protein